MNRYVNKILLLFVSICICFCSFSNVFAAHDEGLAEQYFIKLYPNNNVSDEPGRYYYGTGNGFYDLDFETQSFMFDQFLTHKYWAVINRESVSDTKWLYILFSDYKFHFGVTDTDDSLSIYFDEEDYSETPSYTSGYVTCFEYRLIKGKPFMANNGSFAYFFSWFWTSDQLRASMKGDTSINPFCIKSNFDLRFDDNGTSSSIFNPNPDHGTGTFKLTLNYDPKKFHDVKCLQYPDDEINPGDTFGYVAGDKFGFEWKYDGRVCYAEYSPNADGETEKIKPYKRDDVIGIQGTFANGHDRTITLKEGTGEWYDIIFDFLESLFSGIYIFFKPILDFFANIFDFLWNLIVDVFKFIFVPEEGFFEKFFNDSMELINRKLGILIYPFTLVIDVLSRFLNLPNASSSLMIPPVNIFDVTVFGGVKYDLLGIINADSRFKNLYNIYLSFVDVILIFAVVNLSRRTFSSNFKKGADVS